MRVAVAGGISGQTALEGVWGPERHWEEENSALQRNRSREKNGAAVSSLWSGDEAQDDNILCFAGGDGSFILTPVLGSVPASQGRAGPCHCCTWDSPELSDLFC